MSTHATYSCGCKTCAAYDTPPGFAFSLDNPDRTDGWLFVKHKNGLEEWLKPCAQHEAQAKERAA